MRNTFLPFHIPSTGEEEVQEVAETIRSGWLTTGPKVKRFEEDFAGYVGAPFAVALNSGTAALHVALAAIRLREGEEVIVPADTFTATAEVVTYFKARPVLVDSRRDTFNIDERALEERITPRTRAIIPVHIGGLPCEMDPILEVAQRHELTVIEDAAHALPARYNGSEVGTIGDITAFSFYATKTITTGEGGMATTANPEHADRMRVMSLHGISKDAWNRYSEEGSWYYEVADAGFKYNMTDIAAAMGIHQLRKADSFWERRKQIARLYTDAFAGLEQVRRPIVPEGIQHAWHLYVVLLNLEMLDIDRARFVEALKDLNIGTSVHFIPLHLHPYYQRAFGYRPGDFPDAEWVYQRSVSLPIYPAMTDQDAVDVVEAVKEVAETHRR